MLKIYNSNAITRQQRMNNAILFGVGAALVCAIILWVVSNVIGVYMPVLFIPAAYLISWLIRRYGRGVQIQFSLLAVGLTARVIIITDLLTFRSDQAYFPVAYLFVNHQIANGRVPPILIRIKIQKQRKYRKNVK